MRANASERTSGSVKPIFSPNIEGNQAVQREISIAKAWMGRPQTPDTLPTRS